MTRSARVGALLVAVYVVVAAATTTWAPGRIRPLFDGFGSHPGQYNWVNPPREFAEGNQKPESAEAEVAFDAAGSLAASAGPGDGQVAVAMEPGTLAAHPSDTTAMLTLTPVDPGTLGPLPAGLRPEGNAYRVDIAYESGDPVIALEKPGSVGLTSAAPAGTLLYSLDGRSWESRQGTPLATNNGITGPFAATGYYLAAAEGAPRAIGGGAGSGSGGTVVLVVAVLVVPVAFAWLLLSRRRPRAAAGRSKGGQARSRPGGTTKGSAAKGPAAKGPAARSRAGGKAGEHGAGGRAGGGGKGVAGGKSAGGRSAGGKGAGGKGAGGKGAGGKGGAGGAAGRGEGGHSQDAGPGAG